LSERTLLDRVLDPGGLSVRFQAVNEVQEHAVKRHYFEGLIRGPLGTSVETPDILFAYARKKNCEAELDRACVTAVLRAARGLPEDVRLGLNVHASTLAMDPEFLPFLSDAATQTGTSVERLVVEIVEHAPPWNVSAFREALDALRHIGVAIALDDIGLGHSNFMMILECRPNYMKIDRYFVHGASNDFYRQVVLSCVAQLARPFSARVVAEGVESEADLEAVRAAGIDLAQGHLFGKARPVEEIATPGGGEGE
jgi:EAL domain-containing protein (putative c-di-GMP-specific phosphodiesterase class I)